MEIPYSRNFGKWFASDVLRAMARHAMVEPGERVCVGLSGGKDSVTLLYILEYLRRHSHLTLDLSAVHVRVAAYDTSRLRHYCQALGVPYLETTLKTDRAATGRVCSICARLKRGAAAGLLLAQGIGKIAYGHHADDAAETFLMNLVQQKRVASLLPRLSIAGERIAIIRPLIYLTEERVSAIHRRLQLPLLDYQCPHAEQNIRTRYKDALRLLERSLETRALARRIVEAAEGMRNAGEPIARSALGRRMRNGEPTNIHR